MDNTIVYIQSNEKVVENFRERFSEKNIELIAVKTAGEAIEVLRRNEIYLMLIDINISDMRLGELVRIVNQEFPSLILNVCVDVLNALTITKLVNRYGIHKIYVAPWDVDEMIEEIEESIEYANIMADTKKQERNVYNEMENFKQTMASLTAALKKQQYSYAKLKGISDLMIHECGNFDVSDPEVYERRFRELILAFDTYLRMQTTGSLDTNNIEATIRSDYEETKKRHPAFTYDSLECCLVGGVPKVILSNIRFSLWSLAEYGNRTFSNLNINAFSDFVSMSRIKYLVEMRGDKIVSGENDVMKIIFFKVLENISSSITVNENEDMDTIEIEFDV